MANARVDSGQSHHRRSRRERGAVRLEHAQPTPAESVDLMGGALRVSGSSGVLNRLAARSGEMSGAPCPVVWLSLETLVRQSLALPVSGPRVPIRRYQ